MLEQYGVKWRGSRPIARLREAHHVMRTMLDERSIDFDGDFYSYSGVSTMAQPAQEHLPLKIGAMGGPKSMELAGEIADGLLTACAYSPRRCDTWCECFPPALERAGRTPSVSTSATRCSGRSRPTGRRKEGGTNPGRLLHTLDAARSARAPRHRSAEVAPVNEAFAAGDVKRALAATPDPSRTADRRRHPGGLGRVAAGPYAAAGLTHALVSFADPFTLRSWADVEVAGLPSLVEQVRLFGEEVLPELATA